MPAMDKARQRTDRKLNEIEKNIGREYRKNRDLIAAEKSYKAYMKKVKEQTQEEYDAYVNAESEERRELKKKYIEAVKKLTVYSKEYKRITERLTNALAKANQKALDVINEQMISIYADNYNQVAGECRRVGIKING